MKPNQILTRTLAIALLAATFCAACGNTGCNAPKPEGAKTKNMTAITSFHYNECNTSIANGNESYDVNLMTDGKVIVTIDGTNPLWGKVEVEMSVLDSVQQIVYKYKMHNYKEHYKPAYDVCDGTMWSMHIGFADGSSVNSSGDNAWPKNSGDAFKAITNLMEPYRLYMWEGAFAEKPEDFPVYNYEEEDVELTEKLTAAPFIITVDNLQADSTCNVTVKLKDRYTLLCKGKIDKYEGLFIYLTDVTQGRLPKEITIDKEQPLFCIHPMLFLECEGSSALGLENGLRLVKIRK